MRKENRCNKERNKKREGEENKVTWWERKTDVIKKVTRKRRIEKMIGKLMTGVRKRKRRKKRVVEDDEIERERWKKKGIKERKGESGKKIDKLTTGITKMKKEEEETDGKWWKRKTKKRKKGIRENRRGWQKEDR